MERDYKATLPPASLLVHYAVLLSMDLTYVTAAYAYGRPMQARTNNVSITVYYENGSSNLTAEGYCPQLHLSLPRWQGIFARRSGVLATLVSFLSLVWQ